MKFLKIVLLMSFLLILSCSEDAPTYFYEPVDFDLLRFGSNINDLSLTSDGSLLIASDFGNNRILIINVEDEMFLQDIVVVGSKPNGLCFSPDESKVFVSLSGSSEIAVVDLESLQTSYIPLGEDGPMDIEVFNDQLITTFISDQSLFHRTKLYNIESGELLADKPKAGRITRSSEEDALFVLDQSFERVNLYRFDIFNNQMSGNIQSSDIAAPPVIFNDLEYVKNIGIAVALGGIDFEGNAVHHVFLYESNGLNMIAHLDCKSTPMAVAAFEDGSSIFVSPSEEDGAGTFIIEFDTESYLQRNYYLAAGKLARNALAIDSEHKVIYCAVDDQADNSNDEPYSNNSFDIQRIKIVPFDTYNINDF